MIKVKFYDQESDVEVLTLIPILPKKGDNVYINFQGVGGDSLVYIVDNISFDFDESNVFLYVEICVHEAI